MNFHCGYVALLFLLSGISARAGITSTLTLKTNNLGNTPRLLAYNAGHFYPGSNTRDWWRYSGVTGARVFISPDYIESSDALPPWGDGVTDQATFLSRKALVRSDPLSTNYINWNSVTNRYATSGQIGNNILQPDFACSELRKLGVQILVVSTASMSKFPGNSSWPDKWEIWHFYYEQAFYLGRRFDVQRYQMYNEPNATSLSPSDFLARLQLASDAIQCAIADVNALYGKALIPIIAAPVSAGNATNHYSDWGAPVVANRHVNFLGQTNPNFSVIQNYDYHHYTSVSASYGGELVALQNQLATDMAPERGFPTTISEFNVYTGSTFNTLSSTLDSPANYSSFGSSVVNLIQNLESELYCFKFSQTFSAYIAKNGMHYVDNDTAPYNIGGITRAGEAWRLANKGFAPGRLRKDFTADTGLTNLSLMASYDPANSRYYVFSVNNASTNTILTLNLSALKIPDNNRLLIEEVSEASYGSVAQYARVAGGQISGLIQPSNSVWLLTIPAKAQQIVSSNDPTLFITATDDATVKDGANKLINYGSQTNLVIRNDPLNLANRSAAFMKFHLPSVNLSEVRLAVLSVYGSTLTNNATAQAHLYAITNNNWSQGSIKWAGAPNLLTNISPGNHITNHVVSGLGDSAFLQGQLVFSSTNWVEQQIDVTDFIRSRTNLDVSFLASQDPRWDVTLPSMDPGDTQPDGIRIISVEGAGTNPAPRLKLVRSIPPAPPAQLTATPVSPSQINLAWTDNSTNETGFTVASSTNSGGPYADVFTVAANITNYSNVALAENTTWYYVVRGINTQGDSTNSAEAAATTLAINPQIPVITSQPQSVAVRAGQSAAFSVTATGTPNLRYQWRLNGVPVFGATSSDLTIGLAGITNAGAYVVLVTNAYGSVLSTNALLGLTTVAATGDDSFQQITLVPSVTNVIAIAAGAWHSLALQVNGTVAAWGNDVDGQCDVPATLTDALAIAAGGYHSLALRSSGAVTAWGANDYGQTNIPIGLCDVIGLSAGTWHTLALRAEGSVVAWGDNSWGQTNVPSGLSNVVAVSAGGNHNLALKADGTVMAWGENNNSDGTFVGQSVVPLGLTNVVAIAAGEYHSLAVKGDGSVVAWGDNTQNQVGGAGGISNAVAVAGGGSHSVALRSDGTVLAWGADWNGQCDIAPSLFPAVGIAAGRNHTLLLLEGTLPVPRLLNPAWKARRFTALAQTLNRKNYVLESKDSLAATNWTTPSGVSGNGALRLLTDTNATVAQRFYRMRQP